MVDLQTFRKMALSLPEATEQPHFEKTSFRVNKKIFATFDSKKNRACLMLSELDQSVFTAYDHTVIYPVPNKWGKSGATFINLEKVRKTMLKDALTLAYCKAAPVKRSQAIKTKGSENKQSGTGTL